MFISVIVCTYNRSFVLKNCLESLAAQTCHPHMYEIIVVDNNSTDNTKELVEEYEGKVNSLRYVFEAKQGLSNARNRGCEEARGEYLAYLDDDAIAPPEWLENIISVISKYAPDIMGGPVYPYYLSKKPAWFTDEYETRKYTTESGFVTRTSISGGNYIIRKELVQCFGGFNPKLGMIGNHIGLGEERALLDLYRRLTPFENQRVYYALECYIKHYVPPSKMTIFYRIQRYFIRGKTVFLLIEDADKRTKIYTLSGLLHKLVTLIFDFLKQPNWKTNYKRFRSDVAGHIHGPCYLFFEEKYNFVIFVLDTITYPYHFLTDLILYVRENGFNRRRLVDYLFIQAQKLGNMYGRFLSIINKTH